MKLQRLSRALRATCICAIVGLGGMIAVRALSPSAMTGALSSAFGPLVDPAWVSIPPHAMLAGLAALALAPGIWVLICLVRLFTCFASGNALQIEAARCILSFGRALVLAGGAAILAPTLAGLIASWTAPPGERLLVIQISSTAVGLMVFGGLMVTIGWSMAEAAAQAEENRSFV